MKQSIDAIDRAIILATQSGLPVSAMPFDDVAARIGVDADVVIERCEKLLRAGIIRRIGAIPNHYALGYTANGMTVWDVDDREVDRLGTEIGALAFVTHCYRRPRRPPIWPYNLFAMVHGRSRDEVLEKVSQIKDLLGAACVRHEVLFSKQILKKTGLRLSE